MGLHILAAIVAAFLLVAGSIGIRTDTALGYLFAVCAATLAILLVIPA